MLDRRFADGGVLCILVLYFFQSALITSAFGISIYCSILLKGLKLLHLAQLLFYQLFSIAL